MIEKPCNHTDLRLVPSSHRGRFRFQIPSVQPRIAQPDFYSFGTTFQARPPQTRSAASEKWMTNDESTRAGASIEVSLGLAPLSDVVDYELHEVLVAVADDDVFDAFRGWFSWP